jgi:hypothetical protein
MLKRFLAFAAIVGVVLGVMAGCDNSGEQQRSVVVVRNVNGGAPVVVDVYEQGDDVYEPGTTNPIETDDFVPQAWLVVEFENSPYNTLVMTEPGAPHGDFLIDSYQIQWTRIDGGSMTIPPRTGSTSLVIPSGDWRAVAILLVNYDEMRLPVLFNIRYNQVAAGDEVMMRADITFTGHEVGTERETEIPLSVSVSFADLVVATDDND